MIRDTFLNHMRVMTGLDARRLRRLWNDFNLEVIGEKRSSYMYGAARLEATQLFLKWLTDNGKIHSVESLLLQLGQRVALDEEVNEERTDFTDSYSGQEFPFLQGGNSLVTGSSWAYVLALIEARVKRIKAAWTTTEVIEFGPREGQTITGVDEISRHSPKKSEPLTVANANVIKAGKALGVLRRRGDREVKALERELEKRQKETAALNTIIEDHVNKVFDRMEAEGYVPFPKKSEAEKEAIRAERKAKEQRRGPTKQEARSP
ncbi:MAG: hypothetical protein ABGY43_00440 [bacterium]|jgi:hypothetical protein|nr:hypothetical protein [Gammaproteobacteria bacterium]HIL83194.1 hypothetical protein [Pseudomonadales bacterium]